MGRYDRTGTRRAATACWIALSIAVSGCAADFGWSPMDWSAPGDPDLRELPAADLTAPEGTRARSGELRSVPLKWEPLLVGEVGGYAVERASGREGPFERLAVVPGRLATTYVDQMSGGDPMVSADSADGDAADPDGDSDRLDGVTYFYRVRAYSPTGFLAPVASSVVAATTAPAPAAPEYLRAYSRQPREVPLSWRASDDRSVTGYRVDRSPTFRGPFELLAEVEGRHETVYVDRGLGDLRVFYYQVAARNSAGGTGPATEPVRAVTKPEPLPPAKLRVVEQRLGTNVLAWDPNVEDDIVSYGLLRSREGSESPEIVATLTRDVTIARDDSVAAGERVSYTVKALDRDGLQSDSATPVEVESESYDLTGVARPDGIQLSWNPRVDEGFHGGRVFRRSLFGRQDLGFVDGNSFLDTDVKSGASYRYQIVLERPDLSLAPRSLLVEVQFPKAPAD